MKKLLVILAVAAGGLIVFGIVSNQAEANQAIFVTGSPDELERAKQISIGIMR